MSCAFSDCDSAKYKKEPGITFHTFPKNETRKAAWISAVGLKNCTLHRSAVVCSKHFTEAQLVRSSPLRTYLTDDAVPSRNRSTDVLMENSSTSLDTMPDNHAVDVSMENSSIMSLDTMSPKHAVDISMENSSIITLDTMAGKHALDISVENSSYISLDTMPKNHATDISMEKSSTISDTEIIQRSVLLSIENVNLKRKLERTSNEMAEAKKKIKKQEDIIKKQEKKIQELTSFMDNMKKERFADQFAVDQLNSVAGANKEFLLRQLCTVTDLTPPKEYSPDLRAFALTLHYYSPAAYEYIRKTFNKAIPHQKTIAEWYKQIGALPGFTNEAFILLEHAAKNTPYTIVCALTMDEMAIRPHTEWDGQKHHGYVDVGIGVEDDNLPIAKNAFVFMVTSINCSWKVPVGYFFIDGLNTVQRCNLIRQCLTLLHDTKIKVVSLTCDGLSSNLSTARELGCVFDVDNMKTTFKHPVSGADDVAFMLDPCHMLKLVRNTIGEKKSAVDQNNNFILWEYVTKLQEEQVIADLRLGNNLTQQHVNFYAQKMKVKLASQLFSSSVADAIEICQEAGIDGFEESEATVEFIRNINDAFDILNSRNLGHQEVFKRPLCEDNEDVIIPRLNQIYNYIAGLKVARNGESILNSARKTGFLGFLICIKSMLHLYSTLVKSEVPLLKYLPMYKFNQDHLEVFFSCIRRHCGHNTNPTARQFTSAYKKILVKSEIKHSEKSNCIALEDITILSISSRDPVKVINSSSDRRLLDDANFLIPDPVMETGHDYIQCPENLSEFASTAVEYIAGFIVRQLAESIKCIHCVAVLSSNTSVRQFSLIAKKDRGGLKYPSVDVFRICKRCEQIFKIAVNKETNRTKISRQVLLLAALRSFENENLFPALDVHMHDTSPLENHTVHLIRAVADKYFNIRLFSHSKNLNQTKSYLKSASDKLKKNKKLNQLMGK